MLGETRESAPVDAGRPSLGGRVLAVVGGQAASLVVLVGGTRLLTEYAEGQVFGEARLAAGVASLVGGLAVQPLCQFAMRGFHDADAVGYGLEFQVFARRQVAFVAAGAGLLAALLWLGYAAWLDQAGWALAVATGALVLAEARWSLGRSLLVTRDRQVAASILDVAMHALLAGGAVLGAMLLAGQPVALVGAQALALLVAGPCLGTAHGAVLSAARTNPGVGRDQTVAWRGEAVGFAAPLAMVSLARWVVNLGDRYLLGYMHGARAVGHYAAVYGLGSAPLMACSGMVARLLYRQWFAQGARGRSDSRLFHGMLGSAVVIAGGALAGVWAFGEAVVSVTLAPEYRAGARQLLGWIVAAYGLLVLAAPFEMRAYARKITWVIGAAWALTALANLALNIAWIPRWGAVGAARATLASFAVYLACVWWGTRFRGHWQPAGPGSQG